MIDLVDDDKSGKIEFPEFLRIIKGQDSNTSTLKIKKFFKDLSQGKLGANSLSFPTFVNQIKRRSLLDAICASDAKKKEAGVKIMLNLRHHMQQTQDQKFKRFL